MRIIKFRAWDGESMLRDLSNFEIKSEGGFSLYWFVDSYGTRDGGSYPPDTPIMQYTNLKDKNGVEIYCGDLLAFEAREWYREAGKEDYIFEVSQSETGEWVGAGICTEWSIYCEVIGNIYSNPELIEKVKI